MTAALDAIRARHYPHPHVVAHASDAPTTHDCWNWRCRCTGCDELVNECTKGREDWCAEDDCNWPCNTAVVLAALDRAEAVVAVAREAERLAYGVLGWDDSDPDQVPDAQVNLGLRRDRQAARALIAALRAYEDADKVADIDHSWHP